MKLYGYFRSSAAYRVRIALNLKQLDYEAVAVHLVRGGGEQFDPGYLRLNSQGQVPALDDGAAVIAQSMAIIEYLEEIHPLNNLRVTNFLTKDLGHGEEDKLRWYRHWVRQGLAAFEALMHDHPMTGVYCHGDRPTLADLYLVPQLYNARRFECDLSACPTIERIDIACGELEL